MAEIFAQNARSTVKQPRNDRSRSSQKRAKSKSRYKLPIFYVFPEKAPIPLVIYGIQC